jgi:phospholipid/cholesterol/gamma-HCH transport system ATP-binding protein
MSAKTTDLIDYTPDAIDPYVPRIEFRDVSLAYGDRVVFDRLSFTVAPGEIKVVLGASGSGKSTLLKLVLGLLRPDGGEIFVDGEEITRLSEAELNRIRLKMGMVFQEGALFDSLTVYENVAYRMREQGMGEKEVERRVRQKLEFVGLEEAAGHLPAELSGGMKRRAAIARAVVDDPQIALFDEPTAGLDPPTARTICEMALKLRDVRGVSSIWVTHRLEDAGFLSSRFIATAPGGEQQIAAEDGRLCLINTKLLMLHDGRTHFEGSDEQLWQSKDPIIREFLTGGSDQVMRWGAPAQAVSANTVSL